MTNDPLTLKIAELVPDIFRFEAGCRFKLNGPVYTLLHLTCWSDGRNDIYFQDGGKIVADLNVNRDYFDKLKILGRSPTLADVLRALTKEKVRWVLSPFGLKAYTSDENGVHEELVQIDLALNLDEQTDEVRAFIDKLLSI